MLLGTGHAHIEHPAVFRLGCLGFRAVGWEDALFDAHQKYTRPLQPFRRMHRHQRDALRRIELVIDDRGEPGIVQIGNGQGFTAARSGEHE